MKVAHWTLCNGSGMHRVAEDLSRVENTLGIDSVLVQSDVVSTWSVAEGADINVCHSHVPDQYRGGKAKLVWIGHGTIEHCFQSSVEAGLNKGYGASDPWMLVNYWLRTADAAVTWWPRQQALWQQIVGSRVEIDCIPLGVDRSFWTPQASQGKYAGSPSLFSAENCHFIKWPLDLVLMWPWITEKIPEARLHIIYLPKDQHRWWFPLLNDTGALFRMYVSGAVFDHATLRNAFCSTDYYVNLVRYGDCNRVGLEAKASGCKVISFRGNEYADYWLTEGDQRVMALELLSILQGDTEPRVPMEVPDIAETASQMIQVYERVL